jgi:hypothetical protein
MRITSSKKLAFSDVYIHPFIRVFAQVIWNESLAGEGGETMSRTQHFLVASLVGKKELQQISRSSCFPHI